MLIDTKNLVSISEANQNFSKVARMVDENGAAIILKNNVPKYILLEYSQVESENASAEEALTVAQRIINHHKHAFEELAK